jgi:hypothetical protein
VRRTGIALVSLAAVVGVLAACSSCTSQPSPKALDEEHRLHNEHLEREDAQKEADRRDAEAAANASAEKRLRDELVTRYRAMAQPKRLAELVDICPKSDGTVTASQYLAGYDGCDADRLAPLLEAVRGTPDEKATKAAVRAAKTRFLGSLPRAVKCCDGTESDTCTCNTVHQGCCSHHGGVCGCE